MEIYLLNSNNARAHLIEEYESFIWTERYNDVGDFQMHIYANEYMRTVLVKGRRVIINESERMMVIESVENYIDEEGRRMINVVGRSMENLLAGRVARPNILNLDLFPKWIMTDNPPYIARNIFETVCIDGAQGTLDIFPGVATYTPDPTNRIPEPSLTVRVELEPQSVLDAIRSICQQYDMGFRFTRVSWTDSHEFRFQIYMGYNRTTAQSVNSPVVFAPNLDNIKNTSTFDTISGAANVAYVISNRGRRQVYAPGVTNVGGFNRQVLFVTITDIPDDLTQPQAVAYMDQKGLEALAEHRTSLAFDGEITQNSQYLYTRDYGLGDLVEVRDEDNNQKSMLVTEQIFVDDSEGYRSYPTLSELTYLKDQFLD